MIQSLYGVKKNMTSGYDARGRRVGATVVEVAPNLVTQVKSADGNDGYDAVQLGSGSKKSVKLPQMGHLKKAGVTKKLRWLREIRTNSEEVESLKPGTEIKLNQVFSVGDSVKITGISKGRGFQGGMKRHGFSGGPKTHGQSDRWRAPGSIGGGTTPGRVLKGKTMAGHMGVETVSTKNLEVIGVDRAKNLLTIKGAVPGHTGTLIKITKLGRIKGYIAPPEEKEEEEELESAESKVEDSGEVVADNPETVEVETQPEEGKAPEDATVKEGDQGNAS